MLIETIRAGCRSRDFFGYANGVDADGRYLGLSFGSPAPGVYVDDQSVVVRSEVAQRQLDEEEARRRAAVVGEASHHDGEPGSAYTVVDTGTTGADEVGSRPRPAATPPELPKPTRYYGSVQLDNLKLSSSANQVFQEVVQHLAALMGADVQVMLEVSASARDGFPDKVVRDITENARTLKFESSDFET